MSARRCRTVPAAGLNRLLLDEDHVYLAHCAALETEMVVDCSVCNPDDPYDFPSVPFHRPRLMEIRGELRPVPSTR